MTIKYFNRGLNQTTFRNNVKDLTEAWELAGDVCDEMNWNFDIFHNEVLVREVK